jgi:AcrR family transcriptional regulator
MTKPMPVTDPTAPEAQAPAERAMRADARRSREKLLTAATAAFAENGADAPLEDIARRAGVGIGTLYRHFPTRFDVQEAVFRKQVNAVCAQADELAEQPSPGDAFAAWLRVLASYLVTKRGLAGALIAAAGRDSEVISTCSMAMRIAADRLLTRAQQAGVVRTDLDAKDVMMLVHGVVVSTERTPEDADRLLSLMLDGFRARPQDQKQDKEQEQALQVRRPVLIRRAEHHRRTRRHPRQRPDLLQQLLKRHRGRHPHLEYVVLLPRHTVARLYRRQMLQALRHVIGRSRVERLDRDERGQREPDIVRVEERRVSPDHPDLL